MFILLLRLLCFHTNYFLPIVPPLIILHFVGRRKRKTPKAVLVLVEPFLFAVLYSENFGVSFVFGAFELIKFIWVEEGKWQEEELHHHLSRKSFSHILWKISYQMFHTASQVHHPGVSLLLHWNHFFGQNMGIFFSAPYFHGWLWIGNVIMLLHWSIWFLSIFWKNSLRSLFFFPSLCVWRVFLSARVSLNFLMAVNLIESFSLLYALGPVYFERSFLVFIFWFYF